MGMMGNGMGMGMGNGMGGESDRLICLKKY
jgi:hypothetical protein